MKTWSFIFMTVLLVIAPFLGLPSAYAEQSSSPVAVKSSASATASASSSSAVTTVKGNTTTTTKTETVVTSQSSASHSMPVSAKSTKAPRHHRVRAAKSVAAARSSGYLDLRLCDGKPHSWAHPGADPYAHTEEEANRDLHRALAEAVANTGMPQYVADEIEKTILVDHVQPQEVTIKATTNVGGKPVDEIPFMESHSRPMCHVTVPSAVAGQTAIVWTAIDHKTGKQWFWGHPKICFNWSVFIVTDIPTPPPPPPMPTKTGCEYVVISMRRANAVLHGTGQTPVPVPASQDCSPAIQLEPGGPFISVADEQFHHDCGDWHLECSLRPSIATVAAHRGESLSTHFDFVYQTDQGKQIVLRLPPEYVANGANHASLLLCLTESETQQSVAVDVEPLNYADYATGRYPGKYAFVIYGYHGSVEREVYPQWQGQHIYEPEPHVNDAPIIWHLVPRPVSAPLD